MNDHSFCRSLLASVMAEVKQKFSAEEIKKVWVWSDGRSWEFHGPNDEYFYGLRTADCAWSAKAAGWSKMLELKEKP